VVARIRQRLTVDESAARAELDAALTGRRYRALLDVVDRTADQPAADLTKNRLFRRARACLAKADQRLDHAVALGDGRSPAGEGDRALHAARKAYKRARYAIDVLVPLAGPPAQRLAGHLGDLQDALGAHQDAVVAAALLAELGDQARAAGEPAEPYERLYRDQRAVAERQREAAVDLYRARKSWRSRPWLSDSRPTTDH
jgi:CHAD domain-containing protein